MQTARTSLQRSIDAGLKPSGIAPTVSEVLKFAEPLGINSEVLKIGKDALPISQVSQEALKMLQSAMLKQAFPGSRITNMDLQTFAPKMLDFGMTPDAINQILDKIEKQSDFDIRKGDDLNSYVQSHNGSALGWESDFINRHGFNPTYQQTYNKEPATTIDANSPAAKDAARPATATKTTSLTVAGTVADNPIRNVSPRDVVNLPSGTWFTTQNGTLMKRK